MDRTICERLGELRRSHGYSQEELAERLGLTRQAVSRWERGESLPDTENLIALADLYGVTLDELVRPATASKEAGESADAEAAEVADADDADELAPEAGEPAANAVTNPAPDPTQVVPQLPDPDPASTIPPLSEDEPVPAGQGFAIALAGFFVVAALCGLGVFLGIWNPGWMMLLAIPLYVWQRERHPRAPVSRLVLRVLGMALVACALTLAVVIASSFAFSFRPEKTVVEHGGANGPSSLTLPIDAEDVSGISIDWAAGSVSVVATADEDSILVEEAYPDEESQMFPMVVTCQADGTLAIEYCEESAQTPPLSASHGKELVVRVPLHWARQLDVIALDTASAQVLVADIACSRLQVDTANGEAHIVNVEADQLVLGMAAGSAMVEGEFAGSVEVSLASGHARVMSSATPRTASLGTASGSIELGLPRDAGFKADVRASSGEFSTTFEATKEGDVYTVGDGSASFEVDVASGSVTILSR